MRYFDEITREQIYNPDFNLGKISTENNPITCRYVITQEEVGHEEVVAEYPSGGKDVEWIVDVEEVGHWQAADSKGDFAWDEIGNIPAGTPHYETLQETEVIGIYHTYTAAELEEIAKQKAWQEEQSKRLSDASAYQSNLMANEVNQAAIDHDAATTTIYETSYRPTGGIGVNINTSPFSSAYARQIIRGEKTISQCPQELRTEINAKIAEKPRTDAFFKGDDCTPDNTPAKVTAFTTVAIHYVPDEGFRMPTADELPLYFTYAARDLDDNIIPDYFTKNMTYREVNGEAYVSVYITDNLRDILIRISAAEIYDEVSAEVSESREE